MEKDKIILLEDRGLISITGEDSKNFLQNIVTNDVEKVSTSNSIFSALFTPQGKYLFEFFLLLTKEGFLLDCDNKFTNEIITYLSKYKLRSKIEIKDISTNHVIGLISLEKFTEIQNDESKNTDTIVYRDSPVFIDPRNKKLGARILSTLEKLHLTIKKLDLAKDAADARPEVFSTGNALDAKITELDVKARRVKLSVKAAQIDEEKSLIEKTDIATIKFGRKDSSIINYMNSEVPISQARDHLINNLI